MTREQFQKHYYKAHNYATDKVGTDSRCWGDLLADRFCELLAKDSVEESPIERDRKAYESQLAMAKANQQLCEIGLCIHEEHQQRLLDPGPPPEYHGCLTGDCPHWKQSDCDTELAKYKKE
jgi:hypothetical protein